MRPIPPGSDPDGAWMARALERAAAVRGRVWPNPPVGCVIVGQGAGIAAGATCPGGRPHAERVALERAGPRARGATLYVTLEPCCHWGRTPPCADAIIAAGVARVVAAMQDPDPRVDGGGFARLRAAGIAVTVGPGRARAEEIMAGFLWRLRTGRPLLVAPGTPGADAALRWEAAGPVLAFADGSRERAGVLGARFLDGLGRRGLTSLALDAADPRLAALRAS
ncbi:bifunctional diaminohydroxyphosphoribosylaminopyrimidine deaminase/5-amino-6-(5-phosphoribosylamino)uracil reductase RibD [Poseidonocella sp. HB161398]|uniref:bifunctional diaminohydroxyphosphoribosylaminopyrimidine deaminase/5-amino-6-(5-phosphoribosylamino)uracil reductase RibD n=1 Tax=Poseidonocella sp. HB161398 TaxID=2320855 RepID=UPI003511004E